LTEFLFAAAGGSQAGAAFVVSGAGREFGAGKGYCPLARASYLLAPRWPRISRTRPREPGGPVAQNSAGQGRRALPRAATAQLRVSRMALFPPWLQGTQNS